MATEPEDEPLELTEELESEQSEDQPDEETPETNDEDAEETVVAFDGEEPEPEAESSVIRQMRQELRETKRELSEAKKASQPKAIDVGEKPTLTGCDFDEDRYEAELDAWKERKVAAERQTETQAEQTRKANEAWQQDLTAFEQKKGALQFDDRDDVILTATSSLDMVQQAVVVKAANDPALFLYALGKSPAKLAEVQKIQDPIKLSAAVARMEGAVKVTTRKPPAPDRPLRGSAQMPGGVDKELEKLEKEADRTGDRTKVIAHKRSLRDAAAAKASAK